MRPRGAARGFSLVELVVVLGITVILAGMLMPALRYAKDNVDRVISAANMRQLGLGVAMYDRDFGGHIPYSWILAEEGNPAELMTVYADGAPEEGPEDGWDGLGLLYKWGYVPVPSVFYAPSHRGQHPFEAYESEWVRQTIPRIYGNYHYAGHVDWETRKKRRRLDEGELFVIATDGLRTVHDLNHRTGMNVLRADGSVIFQAFTEQFLDSLPYEASMDVPEDYLGVWGQIEASNR